MREATNVVVIGGGPAGLTVANLLRRCGIDCIVLEVRSREYIETRQRAGIVEYRAVRMFEDWGLADAVLGHAPRESRLEIRIAGESYVLGDDEFSDAITGSLCPQQVLVRNLIRTLLDAGGDLRFDAAEVEPRELAGERPVVSYRDAEGVVHEIACDFVAGCDGDHGASRAGVPDGALTRYFYDHGGIRWLTVLADAPPPKRPLMGVTADGFAAQFARGPAASRFYIQCAADESVDDWPEERIWDCVRSRLGDPGLPTGAVTDREVFAHRSVVYDPMSYGKLFLLGDAAHIISPMGGKGMNLALYDADVFARAVRGYFRDGDRSGLEQYSSTCLRRVWDCQEFSQWLLETTHRTVGHSPDTAFLRQLSRARLSRLTTSPTAAHAYAELMAGLT